MSSTFLSFILKIIHIPSKIEDKIFEIKYNSDESISKIISYFPLSELEHQTLTFLLNKPDFSEFCHPAEGGFRSAVTLKSARVRPRD